MKKLLFIFTMLAFFVACNDNDDNSNDTLITGLEVPKFEAPVKPGTSITIKGEGFTQASEIWFRQVVSKAAGNGDVKAEVTAVNATGITFTAPTVYGEQSILLKENGKEYELGKMTFEEQPAESGDGDGNEDENGDGDESGDRDILSKKVKKMTCMDKENNYTEVEVFEFEYNTEGKITSMKDIMFDGEVGIYTYEYAPDRITVIYKESPDGNGSFNTLEKATLDLKDNKLSTYTRHDLEENEIYKYEYKYAGDYLSTVKGDEDGISIEETFSFKNGNFITYKYEAEDYFDLFEYTYGDRLNNLNIDLFTIIAGWSLSSYSGYDGFLLGAIGKRSKYLPSMMKYTFGNNGNEEETTETYDYKTDADGYITQMTITTNDPGYTEVKTFQFEYED